MARTSRLLDIVKGLTLRQKQLVYLVMDAALVPAALGLAMLVTGDLDRPALIARDGSAALAEIGGFAGLSAFLAASCATFSALLGLPGVKLNSYEQQAILRTAFSAFLVGVLALIVLPLFPDGTASYNMLVVFTLLLTILLVGARFVMRSALTDLYRRGGGRTRVLIYGAGQTGLQLAAALRADDTLEPVAFVDDNPSLHRGLAGGLRVYSPVRLERLIAERAIDQVVLAIPSLSRPKQIRLARKLESFGCDVRTLPSFASILMRGADLLDRIQPVDPEAYLGRSGFKTQVSAIRETYMGRVVMVTGAGGSIGSELCRQVLACRPGRLVLFEMSEFALYQLERELGELVQGSGTELAIVLGSVTDASLVRQTLEREKVEVVLHAAAYKHVSMVERGVLSGLRNNVIGTKVLADAARSAGVERFILISTDKAVRPSSAMGASKRLAELIVQDLATRAERTCFSMVRFGNVLGSSGSVVPLFEEQIARGGPVTITHPDVTRYFMTIGEAARLVLLSGTYSEGGEVFVLDMGTPVAIRDLAHRMIEGAGYTVRDATNPDGDIEIAVIGLRPGEKLHEELIIGSDLRGTRHPKILQAAEERLSELQLASALRALGQAIDAGDRDAALEVLRRAVNGYSPTLGNAAFDDRDRATT